MSAGSKDYTEEVPPGLLLQLLVIVDATSPLVWRRIHVPADYSFWDLHVAIQDAVGWEDSHLHRFRAVDPRSGVVTTLAPPDPEGWSDGSATPEHEEGVYGYVRHGTPAIHYVYDFGDDWHHTIIFEEYHQAEGGTDRRPRCVDGAGACPPEDSGGAHGYAELLSTLADPESERHTEMREWIGGDWDPHAFSVADVWFDDPAERWADSFGGAL